ncbi:MAG: hypothetical protein RLZZ468_599, partial [Cyanobacteriota bacterium]
STQEKVTLFRSLFRGRDDVYALRWQSSSGRSGYAPAGYPSSLAMPVSRKGTLEQHAGRLHRQHQRIHPWRMAAGPMLLYRQLDSAMQVVSFSEARESFKAVLDRVEADADMTLITRRHAQSAVVISLDTYNSLMETVHMLRSPASAAHLQRSLEQAECGGLLSHPLIDADQLDADS